MFQIRALEVTLHKMFVITSLQHTLFVGSFNKSYICLANFTLVSSAILVNLASAFLRALKGSELVNPWNRLQSGTGLKHILLNSLALDNAV